MYSVHSILTLFAKSNFEGRNITAVPNEYFGMRFASILEKRIGLV